ncbi:MAG: tRNA 2-thiocytidine(32) synthetase TtcA [Bacteroidetes bacterium]|nr:MAG: tRNA 2-thiocytidine(32) synthetase TtcA [Bacteroidota bacterium]
MNEKLTKYQKRHLEHVKNMTAKAINQYNMIEGGDKVLAAVSGGKDSLVMLEALTAFKKFKTIRFEIEAIHIDVEDVGYLADVTFLKEYAKKLSVSIYFKTIKAGLEMRGKKAPCFVCSWHRRKTLFEFAKSNGFNKLAMGHHLDDAVETLIINMAYHGHISSLPGKLKMFDGALHLIRPLILLTDKDTREFANIRNFTKLKQTCPFENITKRTTARKLIEQLEAIHPKARFNLFNAMKNIDEEYLP